MFEQAYAYKVLFVALYKRMKARSKILNEMGFHWKGKKKKRRERKNEGKPQENTRGEQWLPLSFLLLSPVVLRISQCHR